MDSLPGRTAAGQVQNRLAAIRQKRGLSAAALARAAGIRRQTVYAIEAGSYVPNTLLALALARVLGVTVEELFRLEHPFPSPRRITGVDLLASEASPRPGQAVRLCRVGRRMVGVSLRLMAETVPLADGFTMAGGRAWKAVVADFGPGEECAKRLLIAGCDPAMSILGRHLMREAGIELVAVGGASLQSLKWLKEGKVHVAGIHLHDPKTGEPNLSIVEEWFPQGGYRVFTFAAWEVGWVVARANPKGFHGTADLARRDIVLVNREPGAGCRFRLDELLKREGVTPSKVRGYDRIAYGHLAAVRQIESGQADCCLASQAAARLYGMHFVPLATDRYDLVVPTRFLGARPVHTLFDVLNHSTFQRELEAVAGYDVTQTGVAVA